VMRELFPTGNEVSAEEMQRKLDAELRRMSDRDLAEVFEAALRSHDADGIQALGTELLGRGADKAKE
jgi:hypothetical protein